MNQILLNKKTIKLKKWVYTLQFLIIFTVFILAIINQFFNYYIDKYYEKSLARTSKQYILTRLYKKASNNLITIDNNTVSILGKIEIPIINISYPIFNTCTDHLLKISVCKFYGPNLDEPGNICIAGHNFENGTFFSKLKYLNINDTINIYSSSGKIYHYTVYNIFEVSKNNNSFLSQETHRSL